MLQQMVIKIPPLLSIVYLSLHLGLDLLILYLFFLILESLVTGLCGARENDTIVHIVYVCRKVLVWLSAAYRLLIAYCSLPAVLI